MFTNFHIDFTNVTSFLIKQTMLLKKIYEIYDAFHL